MDFSSFKTLIEDLLDAIPEEYMTGLQGVHVFEEAKRGGLDPRLVRMGEYLDPGPDSVLDHRVHLGRHVAIYYGSFLEVARNDPGFDWEYQAWDTLTHELQHHNESRAGEIKLIEWDRRALEAYRRNRRIEPWWGEGS
jgi:Zincin-like metallopeptidase